MKKITTNTNPEDDVGGCVTRFQHRTPERDKVFFAALRSGLSNARAAKAAGYALRTIYFWRDVDPDFAALWRETEKARFDDLLALETEAKWLPNPGPQAAAY